MKKATLCRAFSRPLALLVLTFSAAFSLPALAIETDSAQFSKTYSFPISSLEKLEQSLQAAATRTDKNAEAVYVIDSTENSTLHCAGGNPAPYDGGLYGCTLNFAVDLGNGATLTAREIVFMSQTSQQAKDVLAKADPNTASRVDLRAPFDTGKGTAYYCNSEGAAGAKAWACYLNVID